MRVSRKSNLRNERNALFALLGFAVVALVMPLPYMKATATGNAAAQPLTFERLDRNKDGYLDRSEAPIGAMPDLNGDGRIDRLEFGRW